ncbi:MAG: hypothetical protein D6707_05465, partial [Bacteroidetes bacterium]
MKKVLISPIDWGLGHTTRIIPVIRNLLNQNYQVDIAGTSFQIDFLKSYFPKLNYLETIGYNIHYSEKGMDFWSVVKQFPKFFKTVEKEKTFVAEILKNTNYDLIISDSRYAFRNNNVKSVIITHQINIEANIIARKINRNFLNKFDEIWVPDDEYRSLSGKLSYPHLLLQHKIKYIGQLSRFSPEKTTNLALRYDFTAICSGPEPQKSIFYNEIVKIFSKQNKKGVILKGCPEENEKTANNQITIYSHLRDDLLWQTVQQSKVIICRSGYSSIMDFFPLNKPMILIPTPFQTEQEYLAEYLSKKYSNIIFIPQNEMHKIK